LFSEDTGRWWSSTEKHPTVKLEVQTPEDDVVFTQVFLEAPSTKRIPSYLQKGDELKLANENMG